MTEVELSKTGPLAAAFTDPPEPEKKKSEPRSYVVLRRVGTPGSPAEAVSKTYEFVRNVDATSAEQAVRKVAEILVATSEGSSLDTVTLVAVPGRNFQPVTLSVEVETKIKFG